MNASKGYYSLIQYCPDLSRLEAANVGVLLFCPERQFIQARVSHNNDRIRRFFSPEQTDWPQLNALKDSVARRLRSRARASKPWRTCSGSSRYRPTKFKSQRHGR